MRNTPRGKTTMLNILKENHSYRMKRTLTESEREKEFTLYKEMKGSIEKYFKE